MAGRDYPRRGCRPETEKAQGVPLSHASWFENVLQSTSQVQSNNLVLAGKEAGAPGRDICHENSLEAADIGIRESLVTNSRCTRLYSTPGH